MEQTNGHETPNAMSTVPVKIDLKINGQKVDPEAALTLLGGMGVPSTLARTASGEMVPVVDAGVWANYIRPALPWVAVFGAGAAVGVLGTWWIMADDEDDAELGD